MLLLIHGAGSSAYSWNYISLWLDQPIQTIEYTVGQDHESIFDSIEYPEEIQTVIGHSYGGLLGAEWLSQDVRNVRGLITIASPWQGSPTARILNWFLSDPVWNDMKPGSEFLRRINNINLTIPLLNIVAVPDQGNELAGTGKSQNDGTIPVASALEVPAGYRNYKTVELPRTHSEILQCFNTVELIRQFANDPVQAVRPGVPWDMIAQ